KNSIIGYNTVILTHEYLVDEYRLGDVHIGENTMIGANVTILPGVTIGSNVSVGAGAVVSKDIPDNSSCHGNPLVIGADKMSERKVIPFNQSGSFYFNQGLKRIEQKKKRDALKSFERAYDIDNNNLAYLS